MAILALLLVACGQATGTRSIVSESPASASPTTSASAEPVSAAAKLTESGCMLDAPAEVPAGPMTITMTNETPGVFVLHIWRLEEGHDYDEFAGFVAEEMRRIDADGESLGHPDFASLAAEAESGVGSDGELTTTLAAGTYGFACIHFTAEGERGGIWAVGPLQTS